MLGEEGADIASTALGAAEAVLDEPGKRGHHGLEILVLGADGLQERGELAVPGSKPLLQVSAGGGESLRLLT